MRAKKLAIFAARVLKSGSPKPNNNRGELKDNSLILTWTWNIP